MVTTAAASRGDHKALLDARLQSLQPYPAQQFSGSGIVICAGGASLFTNAYVLIHLLRKLHGCALPIEVWHFGSGELSPRMKLLLRELEADPLDAEAVLNNASVRIHNGWQLKAYALMWSRFEQVLMLDADQVPLRDPSQLFQWKGYGDTGAVFWPDVTDILDTNPIWHECNLQPRNHPAIEAGQLLVHKARHWDELQIAAHLNEHASHYYHLLYGDKDTFLLGFLIKRSDFTLVPHRPFGDVPFCLLQRDMEGHPLFQHRTGAKWRYAPAQPVLQGLPIEEECIKALEILRQRWNGLLFAPPARSTRARQAEADLASIRHFLLATPGEGIVDFELLAECEIGAGRSPERMNWYCAEVDGAVRLTLTDAFSAIATFKQTSSGRWTSVSTSSGGEMQLTTKQAQSAAAPELGLSLTEEILAAAGFPSPHWLDRRDEILCALRLLAAVTPDVAGALAALANRHACLPDPQRRALEDMARELQRGFRGGTLAPARGNWPMPGRYSTEPVAKI